MRFGDRFRALVAAVALAAFCAPSAKAAERTIYLTFDDGPLPGTENVLQVLFEENVPATMFMVGLHVETQDGGRAVLKEAKSLDAVVVGNHSYSHAHNRYRQFYSNSDGVIADFEKANGVLDLAKPTPARLPGRNVFRLQNIHSEDLSLDVREWGQEWLDFELVSEAGFRLFGWDHEWVHYNDGKPVQSAKTLVNEIDALFAHNRFVTRGKMILLMHDQMFQDKFDGENNLRTVIRELKKRGYKFEDLTTYEPQVVASD